MKKAHLIYGSGLLIFLSLICPSCFNDTDNKFFSVFGDSLYLKNIPSPPGEGSWKFVDELKSPLWTEHKWIKRGLDDKLTDLSEGVFIKETYPDEKDRLKTVYEDLREFLSAGNISIIDDGYVIETIRVADLEGESFKLVITSRSCQIIAGDEEGIRRGIFQIEEEMLKLRGPYLPLGKIERYPVIKRRISRCVYGPIKRPPALRDELMDTIDYYPDQYLNRLAHEGVNGLWLTVDFRDIVSTKFTPDAARDGKRRLEKLQRTVDKCLRYGIKTYIFTIEPKAWGNWAPRYFDIQVLEKHPELGGVKRGDVHLFCPMTNSAREYLYEAVNKIFTEVSDLGGMINISHGERFTTCLSAVPSTSQYEGMIDCPRCSKKEPWEILYASLSAMEKGMHDAAPDAELISWLYMPQSEPRGDWVYEIPAHTPEGVILQSNFESGVTKTVFDKKLYGADYWLSEPGPSEIFERKAAIAKEHGIPVSAKIQTGNSHEVASVPFVPVPSLIYRKFLAMHKLGVTYTMLAWYMGNDPGLMIKSAGQLSFGPFPDSEEEFLNQLAPVYWKEEDVPKVVEAWKNLADGYEDYPLLKMMGYYGPMHDGPVWPLLLKPADARLAPTWEIDSWDMTTGKKIGAWPPSGDRIGECLGADNQMQAFPADNLTLEEVIELCRHMSETWDKGVKTFENLESKYRDEPERMKDIGLVKALGIQFRSGYHILYFYELREKMFRMEGKKRLEILKQLEGIIREEIKMDEELLELCENDSRLGFHSAAEGYKYFPAKIRWRIKQLENAISTDLPELRKIINNDEPLFPEYTGKQPAGPVATAVKITSGIEFDKMQWQPCMNATENSDIQWASAFSIDTLYVIISQSEVMENEKEITRITVKIEPRRLWPFISFAFNTGAGGQVRRIEKAGRKYVIARIPFNRLWYPDEERHPLRMNVLVHKADGKTASWITEHPVPWRLVFGTENHADLGWLLLWQ